MTVLDDFRFDPAPTIIWLVTLSAINPTTDATSTLYFSSQLYSGGGGPWHPYAEVQGFTSSFASGDYLSPIRSEFDFGQVIIRDAIDEDGALQLDALGVEDLEFSGQDIQIEYVVRLSDGQELAYASRVKFLDGRVGPEPLYDPGRSLTLPVMPDANNLQRPVCDRYQGTSSAWAFNGTTSLAKRAAYNPAGDFTVQGQVFIQAPQASSASNNEDILIDNVEVGVGGWKISIIRYGDAGTAPYQFAFVAAPSGSTSQIVSQSFTQLNKFYWFTARYTASTGLQEIWINDDIDNKGSGSTVGTGAVGTCTEDLTFGAYSTSAQFYDGVMAEIRVFDAALSDEDALDYVGRRLEGNEDDLTIYWRGDSDATTAGVATVLYDMGPSRSEVTGTSTYDISKTVTAISLGDTFEGGEALSGEPKPRGWGYVENVLAVPITNDDLLVRQLVAGPAQGMAGDATSNSLPIVRDGGVKIPGDTTHTYQNLHDFLTTAPATSTFTWFPDLGLVRLGSIPVFDVTGDLWGESPFVAALHSPGAAGDYVDFPSGIDSTFDGSFTIEFWVQINDPDNDEGDVTAFDNMTSSNGGVRVEFQQAGANTWRPFITCGYSGGTFVPAHTAKTVYRNRPLHFAFVAVADGGNVSAVYAYVDGQEVAILEGVNYSMATPSKQAQIFRTHGGGQEMDGMIGEMRLWSDYRSQQEIRENMWLRADEISDTANLFAYWVDTSERDPSQWSDDGGTYHATINGNVFWGGGPTCNSAPQLQHRLADDAGLTVDLQAGTETGTGDMWDTTAGGGWQSYLKGGDHVGLYVDDESEVNETIAKAGETNSMGLVFDRAGADWNLVWLETPGNQTVDDTISEWEIVSLHAVSTFRPAREFKVGRRPIWHVMTDTDLAAAAPDGFRDLVSVPLRYVRALKRKNATRFPLAPELIQIDSLFRYSKPAWTELGRLRSMFGVRRTYWEIELMRGCRSWLLGDVLTVTHARLPGGALTGILVQINDRGLTATIRLWG